MLSLLQYSSTYFSSLPKKRMTSELLTTVPLQLLFKTNEGTTECCKGGK